MKQLLNVLLFVMAFHCHAQLQPGFDKTEARAALMMCNSFTFIDLYNTDEAILPLGYVKRYTSPVFGMDNMYQVYTKGDVAYINFRGSTDKQISWLENVTASMIPAKGLIEANDEKWNYTFAKDPKAAVHSGYALGIAFLRKDVLEQIGKLNKEGVFNIIITGHSQGGALANMLRAYLENLPANQLTKKNKFKTYAFAAPMVGNKEFAAEYNSHIASTGTSFNIVNAADPVPTFPVSYNDTSYIQSHLTTLITDRESFSVKKLLAEGSMILFDQKLDNVVNWMGGNTNRRIAKNVGPVIMPKYVEDINYHRLSKRMELPPVEYPKMLKDPNILKNDSLMAIYERDGEGNFTNPDLYKKQPMFFQHKPYNYYVTFLKVYFPEEHAVLKKKYLQENL